MVCGEVIQIVNRMLCRSNEMLRLWVWDRRCANKYLQWEDRSARLNNFQNTATCQLSIPPIAQLKQGVVASSNPPSHPPNPSYPAAEAVPYKSTSSSTTSEVPEKGSRPRTRTLPETLSGLSPVSQAEGRLGLSLRPWMRMAGRRTRSRC